MSATLYLPAATLWERILERVEVQPDGCWHWTGARNSRGYGCIGSGKRSRTVLVHRVALLVRDGHIDPTLVSDHTCHNQDPTCVGGPACAHRRCVNPAHLEAVTGRVNINRGGHGRETHCVAGHRLSGSNLYLHPHGRSKPPTRDCRACSTDRDAGRVR